MLCRVYRQVRVVTLSCCLFKSNYVVICSYSRTQVKWSGFGFFPHGSQWRLMLLQSRRSWGAGASQPQPRLVPRGRDTCVTDQLPEDPGATYVSFAHIFLGVLLESILNCRKKLTIIEEVRDRYNCHTVLGRKVDGAVCRGRRGHGTGQEREAQASFSFLIL